jgi:predicted CXXCH cytochrome family protein
MKRAATSMSPLRRIVAPLALGVATFIAVLFVLRAVNEAPALPSTEAAALQGRCLSPASQMRRVHMDLLRHERHAAVREGARDPKARMERCVACHAVRDAAGHAVSANDARHFCRSCHDQVAVRVDCFSCHQSRPAIALAGEAAR